MIGESLTPNDEFSLSIGQISDWVEAICILPGFERIAPVKVKLKTYPREGGDFKADQLLPEGFAPTQPPAPQSR